MSMMRRLKTASLIGGLVIALVFVLSPAKQVGAQQNIPWTTGFRVQNLGLGSATVTIELINRNGSLAATINSSNDPNGANPIPQGGSRTYFPIPVVSGSFNGSAIISGTQPIAAILNILGNSNVAGQPFYSGSTSGISQGATEVMLPIIQRGNSGTDTWFAVQNVGTADATATVQFNAAGAGTGYTTASVNIPKGASYVFDQSTDGNLGPWFVGSAVVRGTQPLAVVVNQVRKTATKEAMMTYSGFPATSGSNSVALPMVQQANGGNGSGISVQNAGSIPATVTITYSANLVAGGISLSQDTFTIGVGENKPILKMSGLGSDRYVGSALVTTSSANEKVVVVVNQSSVNLASSYEGVNTSSATPKVSLPLLMTNGGVYTGVQCKNVGSAATVVTLTYNPNTATNGFNPSPYVSDTVPAQGSFNVIQLFAQQYVGGGTISTSPESNIICMVNALKPNAGDNFMTYVGINY